MGDPAVSYHQIVWLSRKTALFLEGYGNNLSQAIAAVAFAMGRMMANYLCSERWAFLISLPRTINFSGKQLLSTHLQHPCDKCLSVSPTGGASHSNACQFIELCSWISVVPAAAGGRSLLDWQVLCGGFIVFVHKWDSLGCTAGPWREWVWSGLWCWMLSPFCGMNSIKKRKKQ